jgi:hypothetical protein
MPVPYYSTAGSVELASALLFALIIPDSFTKKCLVPVLPGILGSEFNVKLSASINLYVNLYPCFVPLANTLSIYGGFDVGDMKSDRLAG